MPKKEKTENNPSAFKLWINDQVIDQYVRGLQKSGTKIDPTGLQKAKKELAPLELRARVRLIADRLKEALPQDYPAAIRILRKAVKQGGLEGFALWPASEFVQKYGTDHFEESFQAMEEWTELFSSEFSVRPFIIQDVKASLSRLMKAAQSKNVHLRRWASEGSRPRLPWGERIHTFVRDPNPTLPILEKLKFDPELYVRKSVSNHLNDIAKDHPSVVIQLLKKWKKEVPKGFETEFKFILRQSLRTLIKKGHRDALALMGVRHGDSAIGIHGAKLVQNRVRVGDSVEFELTIKNKARQPVAYVLDYAIHHLKSNGSHSAKIFKLKSGTIVGQSELRLKKKHSFKLITTREYYPGLHYLEIWLNGVACGRLKFQLD